MDMATKETLAPEERMAKLIVDLTGLLDALRSATVPTKPWQRQLLRDLEEAERQLQVLRLTIAMERHDDEICAAAHELHSTLGRSTAVVSRGRADEATRGAMRLLTALANELNGAMAKRVSALQR